jgi:hypothetical protein
MLGCDEMAGISCEVGTATVARAVALLADGNQPFPNFPDDAVDSERGQREWFLSQFGTPDL